MNAIEKQLVGMSYAELADWLKKEAKGPLQNRDLVCTMQHLKRFLDVLEEAIAVNNKAADRG